MTVVRILFLSLLAGFVAAGFVWYGIEFRQRIGIFMRQRREAKDEGAEEAAESAEEENPGAT